MTEITEKNVQRAQRREDEMEHFVWEEVMEIHYGKNKKKIIAESTVRLKSICHHTLLTNCDRCSVNAKLSATDTHTGKQTNH